MKVFPPDIDLKQLKEKVEINILSHLGIQITALSDDCIEGTMPVDHRTKQTFGLLHGGASVVLAETLGSIAANLVLNDSNKAAVGLEINANHIKSVASGNVKGIAKAIHIGNSTQIWEIKIYNEKEQLTCISRLTVAIINK